MKYPVIVLCGLLAAAPSVPSARAGEIKIELPRETASFKPGSGVELVNAQCLVCHSVDYVATQPPFARTVWAAEVKKMREKYGAAIPEEQVEGIVAYLASNYGTETNNVLAAATNAPAATGEAVAAKYGCLICHNPNVKITGPAYKDVAAKYRDDPNAPAKIGEQIHRGGSGKWGAALMPPFPMVSDAEVQAVTGWIMKQ
jgi:cytochrome c551/c552